MPKTITINACTECPHHQFDYEGGETKYYGRDVCWHGQVPDHDKHPTIIEDADEIPDSCPLP